MGTLKDSGHPWTGDYLQAQQGWGLEKPLSLTVSHPYISWEYPSYSIIGGLYVNVITKAFIHCYKFIF